MPTMNVEDFVSQIAKQCMAFMKTEAAPPPKAKGDSMAKAREALAKKRAAAAAAVAEPVKAKAKKAAPAKAKPAAKKAAKATVVFERHVSKKQTPSVLLGIASKKYSRLPFHSREEFRSWLTAVVDNSDRIEAEIGRHCG
jgi:hypothetical protein